MYVAAREDHEMRFPSLSPCTDEICTSAVVVAAAKSTSDHKRKYSSSSKVDDNLVISSQLSQDNDRNAVSPMRSPKNQRSHYLSSNSNNRKINQCYVADTYAEPSQMTYECDETSKTLQSQSIGDHNLDFRDNIATVPDSFCDLYPPPVEYSQHSGEENMPRSQYESLNVTSEVKLSQRYGIYLILYAYILT